MSFYSVNATISARAQQMDSARQTLKNYMMIVKDDEVFAFYGGNQIDGFGKISIPLGMAIKLTENEILIVQSLGPREAYENYEASLVEIFSSRLHDAGFDPDDVHEFMGDIVSGSAVDVIAEMDIDSFSIDCYISSSGFVFNGQSVKLPGEVRILEEFERVEFDQGHCWSFRSQEKVITVDPDLDEAASFEFDRIDELLWSSLDEAGRPRGRVLYPAVG